ncbi:MAG: RNA 2'-phosphotransferase [Methanopyri archaeon]|nr:RNA 2'-phosphotransferase [Methanopyri archaeon]
MLGVPNDVWEVPPLKPVRKCPRCGTYTEKKLCPECGAPTEVFLDGRRRLALSRLLAGILRHFPEEVGVELDEEGFTDCDVHELAERIKTRWKNREYYRWLTGEHIVAVAETCPKGRFEIDERGRIRARYGHSRRLHVRPTLPEAEDVDELYHGTARENLERILREGIRPMGRKYVHLTDDVSEAVATARRHSDDPVVLVVDVSCLRRHGLVPRKAGKTVYVVPGRVPPECISRVIKHPRRVLSRATPPKAAPEGREGAQEDSRRGGEEGEGGGPGRSEKGGGR